MVVVVSPVGSGLATAANVLFSVRFEVFFGLGFHCNIWVFRTLGVFQASLFPFGHFRPAGVLGFAHWCISNF